MIGVCEECCKKTELYDERGTIKDPKFCLVCFAAMTGFYFNYETNTFHEEDEILFNEVL